MKAKRVVEEQIMVPVPRSALMVAAPPATVTQRSCMAVFGITPSHYLRLAGAAFPVKREGQLRVARYADVEAYLTSGAEFVTKSGPTPKPAASAPKLRAVSDVDVAEKLRKAGFAPTRR